MSIEFSRQILTDRQTDTISNLNDWSVLWSNFLILRVFCCINILVLFHGLNSSTSDRCENIHEFSDEMKYISKYNSGNLSSCARALRAVLYCLNLSIWVLDSQEKIGNLLQLSFMEILVWPPLQCNGGHRYFHNLNRLISSFLVHKNTIID